MRRPGDERDPRVAVVHGCHSEGGDSILSAFSWEPLASEAARQLTTLAN